MSVGLSKVERLCFSIHRSQFSDTDNAVDEKQFYVMNQKIVENSNTDYFYYFL